MGYPMTWKRLINRNGLGDGTYSVTPTAWVPQANTETREPIPPEQFTGVPPEAREATTLRSTQDLSNFRADALLLLERKARNLAGDLRRLEHDTVDEGAICEYVATRTGIDVDKVAAVLKEFMDW